MATRLFFFFIATALLLVHACALNTETGETVHGSEFSYSGETGPANWGRLSPSYTSCSTGKMQSPIDIVRAKAVLNKNLKPLNRQFYTQNATLINHGYGVEMQFANAGPLIADGKNYTLKQMHWHTPSEHTFDGVGYDAELHLVHKASDGSTSVIGILYKLGTADPLIAKVQDKFTQLAKEVCPPNEEGHIAVPNFPTWKLRRNTRKYYTYTGSFTSPPCTENVIWRVFAKVRTISKEQIEALKAPLKPTCKTNVRPVQPLNGRQVELFSELD